jgi:glycosyltransferase involved in cell wall biosynthesis
MTGTLPPGWPDSRPLRILYVTARFLPERGGTEIHTHEVAKRMSQRGAHVTVLATSRDPGQPREEWDGAVRIRRVRAWPRRRDYFFAPELSAEIRAVVPDLLHCQGYHTFVAPVAMMAALRASIPYVVTLHSGGHSSRLRVHMRPLQVGLLRPLLVRARALVAVSEFEADLFSRRLRISPDRFAIIPSGINLPHVSGPLGPTDACLVLSIGRLESYKGHDRIIEALPALRLLHPDVRLRIVGSGPCEPRLRRLAVKLDVADAVDIAPLTSGSRRELAELLNRAAVVTALSRYESQGLAVQEAIGLGRPVVVNEGSALDELRVYPNVLTVSRLAGSGEVADAVSRMLQAPPADTPAMQTWDDCVDALVELYGAAMSVETGLSARS